MRRLFRAVSMDEGVEVVVRHLSLLDPVLIFVQVGFRER